MPFVTPRLRYVIAAALTAAMLATLLTVAPNAVRPAAAAVAATDGTSPETAAASCWAIKQHHPASTDGLYFLRTPQLVAPEQFYCDMTTDGGGWVLVARGRENWTFNSSGQRSPYILRSNVANPAAFKPAALPASKIDALVANTPIKDLPDGVRVRRAKNSSGTSWQELRLDFESLDSWAWGFGGGMLLDDITIDGSFYDGSNTADTRSNYGGQSINELLGVNDNRRLTTRLWSTFGWRMGFAYGQTVCGGSSSSTSFLFDATGNGCQPMPFTQVWVRPMLDESDLSYAPLPAGGLPAQTIRPMVGDKPSTTTWGVTGLAPSQFWANHEVQVWAFAEIGDRIFVGGKFAKVRNNATSTEYSQPYLAAFDRDTGAWISDFTPDVEGPVYDLHATPDGRLVVAGEFKNIDGAAGTHALAVLDPLTGAVDASWISDLHRLNGNRTIVNDLDVEGNWLYAVGDFEEVHRDAEPNLRVWRTARFDVSTGQVDWTWRPAANYEVIAVDATPDRTYFAGRFAAVNNSPHTANLAAVSTATGATVTGLAPFIPSHNKSYQQTVGRYGDRVFVGGSEHNFWTMDAATHTRLDGSITLAGGDYQTMAEIDGVVYASCHCNQWNYEGAVAWPSPTGYRRVDKTNYLIAYDAVTGEILSEFTPDFYVGSFYEGPWESFVDSHDCLWLGGDLNRGAWNGASYDWLGGFGRFCQRDSVAPNTPANVAVTLTDDDVLISYDHAMDDKGDPVTYEILRDDRVINHIGGQYYTDADITGPHTYAVRSIDNAGNRSATSVPVTISYTPPPTPLQTLVAAGSTWSYLDTGAAPVAGWTSDADVSAWPTGPAEFGWGDGDEATVVNSAPNAHFFVKDIAYTPDPEVRHGTIRVRRDDGIVVYVNGYELYRDNTPGAPYDPVGTSTYANGYVYGDAESTWIEIPVPGHLVTNNSGLRIAVGLFQPTGGNVDGSFDLEFRTYGDDGDTTPPAAPVVAADTVGHDSATLSWPQLTDDVAIAGAQLLIFRNGEFVDELLLPATATTWSLTGLDPASDYEFRLVSIDTNNNGTPGSAFFTTDPDPVVLPLDATWRYRYAADAPGAWTTVGFDDTAWPSGVGKFGFGDGDETTVIGSSGFLVAYFRTTFDIADPASGLELELLRDDGVIVYVNGVEIGRDNLPAGNVGHTTYTSTTIYGAAEDTAVVFTVPPSALVTGSNTIAVAIHQDSKGSPDLEFLLQGTAG